MTIRHNVPRGTTPDLDPFAPLGEIATTALRRRLDGCDLSFEAFVLWLSGTGEQFLFSPESPCFCPVARFIADQMDVDQGADDDKARIKIDGGEIGYGGVYLREVEAWMAIFVDAFDATFGGERIHELASVDEIRERMGSTLAECAAA